MIASNYIKHPEALRFQCEMFSNGYHNSPRIMRLMQVIFSQLQDTPQWFKDAQARTRAFIKHLKKGVMELNFKSVAETVSAAATTKRRVCLTVYMGGSKGNGYLDDPVYYSYCANAGKKNGHPEEWSWGMSEYAPYWGGFSN